MSNLQSVSGHLQNEDSDIRCRRLLFRCWHQGTQESDVILGRFAEPYLADFEARNSTGSKLRAIALTSMCSTGSSQRGVDASKGTRVAPDSLCNYGYQQLWRCSFNQKAPQWFELTGQAGLGTQSQRLLVRFSTGNSGHRRAAPD